MRLTAWPVAQFFTSGQLPGSRWHASCPRLRTPLEHRASLMPETRHENRTMIRATSSGR
jgi:hypothetical protein